MLTILSVGQDADLLETRAAVLHRCNAGVVSASGFTALEILKDQSFDLVVLCHTLTSNERNELAVVAHQREVKVLEVLNFTERHQRSAIDGMVDPNPHALVAKVAEMLSAVVNVE